VKSVGELTSEWWAGWRPWYAWRPVKVATGEWVWLRRIERYGSHYGHWDKGPQWAWESRYRATEGEGEGRE